MPSTPTPSVGLAALFLLPLLANWLFKEPMTSKHWLRRHICGGCGASWTDEHRLPPGGERGRLGLRGQLRRLPEALQARLGCDHREAPKRFRGLVRVQRTRRSRTDWYRSAAWALMCEVLSRVGGARALPGRFGEAS